MGRRTWAALVGAALGAGSGWMLAQEHMGRHQQDLFSPRRSRRFAALGYLGARGGVETIRLLRDYLEWEAEPVLRRRAEGLIRRFEGALG